MSDSSDARSTGDVDQAYGAVEVEFEHTPSWIHTLPMESVVTDDYSLKGVEGAEINNQTIEPGTEVMVVKDGPHAIDARPKELHTQMENEMVKQKRENEKRKAEKLDSPDNE
jgi:hypothetical protein